ncbi:MAG: lytic transglycosylase domain-containing protein [Solirubrobacterales bacterium]
MSAQSEGTRLTAALIAVPIAGLLAAICGAVSIALTFGGTAAGCGTEPTGTVKDVPARLVPIYQGASAKYKLGTKGPTILAAINFIETGFGANLGPSSAGAQGWMQFMPATWAAYGVDGDGDGDRDPDDPWDAIHAAANYLHASGAPKDWRAAIFAYNHADWYVEDVLAAAKRYAGAGATEVAVCSISAPNERVARMIAEADRLSAMRPETKYVWGGSHGVSPTPRNGPFDCSSAVSHLLQVGGFRNPTMTTVGFASWGRPGPGQWVTILNKPHEPEAHVILRFEPGVTPPEKRYWGTSSFIEDGGKGPGWIPESAFDAGYLSRFESRHQPGF